MVKHQPHIVIARSQLAAEIGEDEADYLLAAARKTVHSFWAAPWWRTVKSQVVGYEGIDNLVIEVALLAHTLTDSGQTREEAVTEAGRQVLAYLRQMYTREGRPSFYALSGHDLEAATTSDGQEPDAERQAILDRIATRETQDIIYCYAKHGERETAALFDMNVEAVRWRVKAARRKARQ